ncbi:MAG: hypothetical protein ACYDGS_05465 [Thermoleophilia bacterium]
MTAYKITCTVIPEREDDAISAKFLIVAPEDRIVWIATASPRHSPDLSAEGRRRAVAQAGLQSLLGKLRSQEAEDGDILSLTDRQIDCRDRNLGKCNRYPQVTVQAAADCPEGAVETREEDDCYPGVLECWMLEEEVD